MNPLKSWAWINSMWIAYLEYTVLILEYVIMTLLKIFLSVIESVYAKFHVIPQFLMNGKKVKKLCWMWPDIKIHKSFLAHYSIFFFFECCLFFIHVLSKQYQWIKTHQLFQILLIFFSPPPFQQPSCLQKVYIVW